MAVSRWISTSGDASQAASWSNGIPAGGDIAVFDGYSQVSWTAGMSAIALAEIRTTEDYKGDIGGPGSYAQFTGGSGAGTPGNKGTFRHTGRLFFYMDDGASGDANLARLDIAKPLGAQGDTRIDGQFGYLIVRGGGVTLDDSLAVSTSVYIFGDTLLEINENTSLPSTFDQYGGRIISRNATSPTVYGGHVLQQKATTTINVQGGTMAYDPDTSTAPTTMNLWAGVLELRGAALNIFDAFTGGVKVGPDFLLIGVTNVKIPDENSYDLRQRFLPL